jgi:hypothetical protein
MRGIGITAGMVLAASIASSAWAIKAVAGMPIDQIDISAEVRHTNTRLEINWAVTNRGAKAVLVLSRPLRHNREASDAAIYVRTGEPGTIEFALRAFGVPEGLYPTALDKIGAVPLEPGQRLEGRASVTLPLTLNMPYQEPTRLRPDLHAARFCIGFVKAMPDLPGVSRLPDGTLALFHEAMTTSQQGVGCIPVAVPAPKPYSGMIGSR